MKSVPRGFPKNTQKLLQSMAVEPNKPQTSKSQESVPVRPLPPLKKKVPTAHQQPGNANASSGRPAESQTSSCFLCGTCFHSPLPRLLLQRLTKAVNESRTSRHPGSSPSAPRVAVINGCNINIKFRQQVLDKFGEHQMLICKDRIEAVERAVATEKEVASHSNCSATYRYVEFLRAEVFLVRETHTIC